MGFFDFFSRSTPAVQVPKPRPFSPVQQYRNAFVAAATDRLNESWYGQLSGPNREMLTDIKRLRGLSRHLARNDVYAARYLSLVETRIVGPSGMHFQPRVLAGNGEFNLPVNNELARGWEAFKTVAALDGSCHFVDLEQLIIRTVAMDGEAFIHVITDARVNAHGIALRMIDADQIDHSYTDLQTPTGNVVSQGVEVDRYGVRVAYHMLTGHPDERRTNKPQQRVRVPADEIIHIYRPARAGQYRGIPWMTNAMDLLGRLWRYMDAELIAAQAAASQLATIESPLNDASSYQGADNTREIIDIEPATMLRLAPGEKMTAWNTSRPTTAFGPFVNQILHGLASALNVSYSTLASDMSQDNYSAARMSGQLEQKHWDNLQSWFIRSFHQKVYAAWLQAALSQKALDLPDTIDEYTAVLFRGPKLQSPDIKKDLEAARTGFELNVLSKTKWCAENGHDYHDVLNDRYEEEKLERQYEQDLRSMGLQPTDVMDAGPAPPNEEAPNVVNEMDTTDDAVLVPTVNDEESE